LSGEGREVTGAKREEYFTAETQRRRETAKKDGWVRDGRRHVFPWLRAQRRQRAQRRRETSRKTAGCVMDGATSSLGFESAEEAEGAENT
jgi:hypothetical protein